MCKYIYIYTERERNIRKRHGEAGRERRWQLASPGASPPERGALPAPHPRGASPAEHPPRSRERCHPAHHPPGPEGAASIILPGSMPPPPLY